MLRAASAAPTAAAAATHRAHCRPAGHMRQGDAPRAPAAAGGAASAEGREALARLGGGALRALLFDVDGTLVDSDPLHMAVFRDMFLRHGAKVRGCWRGFQVVRWCFPSVGDAPCGRGCARVLLPCPAVALTKGFGVGIALVCVRAWQPGNHRDPSRDDVVRRCRGDVALCRLWFSALRERRLTLSSQR